MRICGIELKGSEANICLLALDNEVFQLPDCRARKLTYPKQDSTKEVREFQFTFKKLMEDYKIDAVAIRERPTKGKFAGSAAGFKMEAAIQLIEDLDVLVMNPTHIKEILKRNPIPVAFSETGLKMFQEVAFSTAFAYLMKSKYSIEEQQPED